MLGPGFPGKARANLGVKLASLGIHVQNVSPRQQHGAVQGRHVMAMVGSWMPSEAFPCPSPCSSK